MFRDEMVSNAFYMRMALDVAAVAKGQTAPNPLVGAVLVKDGNIVGFGAHLAAGTLHAEAHALQMAGAAAQGATLYVTLEPCSHFGRMPPCADAVIAAGVRRVFVAMIDPFPAVSGRGIERLRAAGVEVHVGLLQEDAAYQNRSYLLATKRKRPFVTWKTAMSQDGYIAARNSGGYLSGPEALAMVHHLRHEVDAIAVGSNTVLTDDPRLTTRVADGLGRQPLRVIFDSRLQTPVSAQVIQDSSARTLILCAAAAEPTAMQALSDAGAEILCVPGSSGQIVLEAALALLWQRGVHHLLLEGGRTLTSAFLRAQLIDEAWLFHTPLLLGGGLSAYDNEMAETLSDGISLTDVQITQVGNDSLTRGRLVYGQQHEVTQGGDACSQD